MSWSALYYGLQGYRALGRKRYKRLRFAPGRLIARPPTYSRRRYRSRYRGTVFS